MKTELINEFYLMQQSRVANKYSEVLEEEVYVPLKNANHKMTTWISERGHMLMNLDVKLYNSMKHLRKKYLKF